MTRDQALADLGGSTFRDAHRDNMRDVFTRLDRARGDLQMLRIAGPLERMLLPHRLRDPETLAAAWGDFRPAVPVTAAGLWAAGMGLALGWLLTALPGLIFRRRQDRLGWR